MEYFEISDFKKIKSKLKIVALRIIHSKTESIAIVSFQLKFRGEELMKLLNML